MTALFSVLPEFQCFELGKERRLKVGSATLKYKLTLISEQQNFLGENFIPKFTLKLSWVFIGAWNREPPEKIQTQNCGYVYQSTAICLKK